MFQKRTERERVYEREKEKERIRIASLEIRRRLNWLKWQRVIVDRTQFNQIHFEFQEKNDQFSWRLHKHYDAFQFQNFNFQSKKRRIQKRLIRNYRRNRDEKRKEKQRRRKKHCGDSK